MLDLTSINPKIYNNFTKLEDTSLMKPVEFSTKKKNKFSGWYFKLFLKGMILVKGLIAAIKVYPNYSE